MADRPTDLAIAKFQQATAEAKRGAWAAANNGGHDGIYNVALIQSIQLLVEGMSDLSVGLRAIYILLEEMNRRQRTQRP